MTKLEFQECDTCRAKPGTPALCSGCLHNRWLIGELSQLRITGRDLAKQLSSLFQVTATARIEEDYDIVYIPRAAKSICKCGVSGPKYDCPIHGR